MSISIIVTIVLGFATCISPPLVALINNYHARKIRKIELDASQSLRKLELNSELAREVVLSDRELKYKVLFNFVTIASLYIFDYNDIDTYTKLLSAYSECLAIGISEFDLEGYMQYVKLPSENFKLSENSIEQMRSYLEDISRDFNTLLKKSLNSAIIE